MGAELLTMTSPLWQDPAVFEAIAAGPGWPGEVHKMVHPRPVFNCDRCPPSECPSCGLSAPEHAEGEASAHARVWREGETSLLFGGATLSGRR